jgi:hypothetical protein
MNVISKARVDAIREAFEKGLSHRATAAHVGVTKNTVARYFNRWTSADYGGEMTCIVKGETKRTWKAEAEKREMSVRELHAFVIETIAEENIFEAVLG